MPKRILIVEDDETNATVIHDYLESMGYETSLARDGVEGVERFREQRPDLVIIDLLLPRKNGFETCAEIRAMADAGEAPILLMSAVGVDTYREAFARVDDLAQAYLRKPFSMATLAETVAELIGPA